MNPKLPQIAIPRYSGSDCFSKIRTVSIISISRNETGTSLLMLASENSLSFFSSPEEKEKNIHTNTNKRE